VVRQQLATGGEIRHSAAVVASWARYAEGVDEAGSPSGGRPAPGQSHDAGPAAARGPAGVRRQPGLFGDLADQERFATAYTSTLVSLHQRGARATLTSLL
jgi:Mannitol-1-phosphate/altronate dehydrogenases